MKINSVSKTNFKAVYVAFGSPESQKQLARKCAMHSDIMSCIPIKRDELSLIGNKNTRKLIDKYVTSKEEASLVIDGRDLKRYRNDFEYDKNKMLKNAKGVMFLPFLDKK